MQIEIYSDTICPWCFIGKRRLERALAERPQEALEITWRAFQLNPDMPAEGMDRQAYLQLKFGGADNARQVYDRVREAGREEAIPFAFEAIQRTPNTIDSHRLIRHAEGLSPDKVEAVVQGLFDAYFIDGRDIGDLEVLTAVAAAASLEAETTRAFLESDEGLAPVRAEDNRARQIGIQGVPTFIFNNKYVLSGAHPPEVLHQLFDLSAQDDATAAE